MTAPYPLLSQRPLVWAGCGFASGVAIAPAAAEPALWVFILAALGLGIAATLFGRSRIARPLGVLFLFVGAGVSWSAARADNPRDDELFSHAWSKPTAEEVILEGRVAWPSLWNTPTNLNPGSTPMVDGASGATSPPRARIQFTLHVDAIEVGGVRRSIASKCLVRWSDAQHGLFHGQRLRVEGKLYPTLGTMNPGVSSAEVHHRLGGMHTLVRSQHAEGVAVIAQAPWWSPGHWASRIREAEAGVLARTMPAEILPFVYTVWLGERSGIAADEMERFAVAGTAHVLAVSGVHIAIVFVSVASLMGRYSRRRLRAFVLLAFLWLFVLLTGARVSVVRAAIMLSVYLVGELFGREPDPPTSLAIAAMGILMHSPAAIMNAGFQMSFLSVASLLLITPRIDAALSAIPRSLRLSLSVTLAVQVLSLPAAASTFHVIPLLSPLVNLLVVPLLAMLLWLTMAATLLGAISASVGSLFGHAAWIVVECIERLTYGAASAVGDFAYWGPPSALAIVLYFGIIFIALFLRGRRGYRWGAVCVMSVCMIVFWSRDDGRPFLAMLDVGHGDATVIRSPEGTTVLIDGGDRSQYGDMGQRVVAPFLRAHNVRHLDIVIATHGDRDHVGGLFTVIDRWSVGELWISAASKGGPLENALVKECSDKGIPIRRVATGLDVDLGGAQLSVVHPATDWADVFSENDGSIVLRYAQDGVTTLLTADIEFAGEAAVRRVGCQADILKAPHHGSNTSSSAELIADVGPELAIASTGMRPGRDPVHMKVADRYDAAGVPLWRTDRAGGVIFRFFEGSWTLEGARAARGWIR